MLTQDQVEFYKENGYLHVPQVFSAEEMDWMDRELDFLMDHWAATEMGWTGPWRLALMDPETEQKSKLTSLHDLHLYTEAWMRAVSHRRMGDIMEALISPNIEVHHMTLHAKPPETGHPFPCHQDNAFYEHTDNRYIDALIHLDDTNPQNGEIRFMAGSHKEGYLPHVLQTPDGEECTPHLPTDKYKLEDTVAVPAKRGDVVLFNIFCIHGSYINTTDKIRRMVRCGYRDPANKQISGQSVGRPGIVIRGHRLRTADDDTLTNEAVA